MYVGGCITLDNYLTLHSTDIAFQIAKDLKFTASRSLSGKHGNVAHINMKNDANWAENLYNLLTLFDSYGLKLVLHEMGDPWGTSLGLLAPYYNYQPASFYGASATPISEGLAMIDELAGDNSLGHNFFTDPRMPYWQVINEANIEIAEVQTWTAAIADRIRSYGGKVTGTLKDTNHRYAEAFPYIMPFLEQHFDLIQAHEYFYYVVTSAISSQGAAAEVYQPIYDRAVQMFNAMLGGSGPFRDDEVILGEWGFWHGSMKGPGMSTALTVTHHQHAEYIRGVFDAMKDVGLKNQYYHLIFDDSVEFWGVVDQLGAPYIEEYSSFKAGMPDTPPTPPTPETFPLWLLAIPVGLMLIEGKKKK